MATLRLDCNNSADVHWDVPNTVMDNTDSVLCVGVVPRSGTDDSTYSFLKFTNWTAIPDGAIINSATLYMYYHGKEGDAVGQGSSHRVRRCLGSWTQSGITFNNAPDVSSVVEDNYNFSIGSWANADITDWVRDARDSSTIRSYGLRLSNNPDANNNYPNNFLLRSHNSTNNPYIIVNYTPIAVNSSITSGPSGSVEVTTASFSFSSNISGSTFQTRLDGGLWENASSPKSYSGLALGSHTFEVRAIDPSGIVETTPATRTWTIVTPTPPTIEVANGANSIGLSGGGVSGATSVEIHYAPTQTSPFTLLKTVTPSGSTYSTTDAPTAPAPNAPTSFTAVPGTLAINLAWGVASQPAFNRWYKSRKLIGGQLSDFNTEKQGSLTPTITKYQVFRKRSIDSVWPTIPIYEGTALNFSDTGIVAGIAYDYRIQAINSQGTNSVFATASSTLEKPPAPIFDSLTVVNNNTFRLSGSGAPTSGLLRIYNSTNGVTYSQLLEFATTQSAWQRDIQPSLSAPNAPTFQSPTFDERKITIKWTASSSSASTQYFKVSKVVNGVESELTAARNASITPLVVNYRLERKIQGQADNLYTTVYIGQNLEYTDEDILVNISYVYRITAITDSGLESNKTTVTYKTTSVTAPTIFPSEITQDPLGVYSARIGGGGIGNATAIRVQRFEGDVWNTLGDATIATRVRPDGNTETWTYTDSTFLAAAPDIPFWSQATHDSSGVQLGWIRPINEASDFSYRAIRLVDNVEGTASPVVIATIRPTVLYYRIERRETPVPGAPLGPQNQWSTISNTTSLTYTDTTITFGSVYDYRIVAVNNQRLESSYSPVRTIDTSVAPPEEPPPPVVDVKPVISNPQPSGNVDMANATQLRISWNYSDERNRPQVAYILKVMWTDEGLNTHTRYWNGTTWVSGETAVNSNLLHIDIDTSILEAGRDYEFTLKSQSESSLWSDPLTWSITPVFSYKLFFDTQRRVDRTYISNFDTYRKVITRDPGLGFTMNVTWEVEENLPFEVDDEEWEGGGNAWIETVFDNRGEPEPYAEIDFVDKDNITKTFQCDHRGRLVITIPDDLVPGIYTKRERGPSMAPRTTRNYPVYDPWLIHAHGHRHAADGGDPIFGITKEQIADNAGILASQVEGAESLADLVSEYGSQLKRGLEKHVSAGHGNYVVEGLNASYANGKITVQGGVCWESGRLRKLGSFNHNILVDDTYKIYVSDGEIRVERRIDFPPDTCPLYTLMVSASGAIGSITDNRLRHPSFNAMGVVTPVRWGANSTGDIDHKGRSLESVIDTNVLQLNSRLRQEELLHNIFFENNRITRERVDVDEIDRRKAREALLSVGYTNGLKTLYALFSRKKAKEALTESRTLLTSAGKVLTLNYLNSIALDANLPVMSHLSAFRPEEEISSISNILVSDGLATLPNNWVRGARYMFRTLRIDGAPSKLLEFHLVYEDIGSDFEVHGSINTEGKYLPKIMQKTRTIKDNSLKDIFGVTNDCFIDSYRTEFVDAGDEAIIEVLCSGTSGQGMKLRGWFVVMA